MEEQIIINPATKMKAKIKDISNLIGELYLKLNEVYVYLGEIEEKINISKDL